jgi:hypothetical protein
MPHRTKSYRLYETAFSVASFQAVNCQATLIKSLRDQNASCLLGPHSPAAAWVPLPSPAWSVSHSLPEILLTAAVVPSHVEPLNDPTRVGLWGFNLEVIVLGQRIRHRPTYSLALSLKSPAAIGRQSG